MLEVCSFNYISFQLAASGGTFLAETINDGFSFNSLLPMTYSIRALEMCFNY